MRHPFDQRFFLSLAILLCALVSSASAVEPALEDVFQQPPDTAKPLTWWHWIDGNVSKDGITRDLEAMKRAGLGGCYLFNVGLGLPAGDKKFLQEDWLALLDHTVSEAKRLGLVFGVHNCDGFSQAGGPWVEIEHSMKMLTWSVTEVAGPGEVRTALAQPEAVQDFYRDIAVLAYPLPPENGLPHASLQGSLPAAELSKLTDGQPATHVRFPAAEDGHQLDFAFDSAQVARSLVIQGFAPYRITTELPARLEVSGDGETYRTVSEFDLNWSHHLHNAETITIGFEATRGRYWRLSLSGERSFQLAEVELSDVPRVHYWEAKAGWARRRRHGGETQALDASPGPAAPKLAGGFVIPRDLVLDISERMDDDGNLNWSAPEGRWAIMRLGYTTTGKTNGPATPEGRGLEVDKLDHRAVRAHLEQYVGRLAERFGPEAGKAFSVFEVDSWECGIQNWTEGLGRRFGQEFGYDLLTFVPLLAEGWIVGDYGTSERMLWDWRHFLADQFSKEYFAEVARFAEERGLTYVSESSGRQQYMYAPIRYQRNGTVPMGEFWNDTSVGGGVRVDNRVAASVAHITGRRIVASESYTSSPAFARWQNHPFSLKPLGDRAFCDGVNQYVFHTFTHQPWADPAPGMIMRWWGLHFHRGNTWWEPARAWVSYITRCQYLLQEGQFVADVLYFIGDGVPARLGGRDEIVPRLPAGYDFDGCDFQALREAEVQDGDIVLPSGMRYRVLILPDREAIRSEVLQRIVALVRDGATVIGPKPRRTPSLADRGGDAAVQALAKEAWSKGSVYWDRPFQEVADAIALVPDFDYSVDDGAAELLYIHRRIGSREVYFVSNQENEWIDAEARFRVTGRQPELWRPATGRIERPSAYAEEGPHTAVDLSLPPHGSVFVVFPDAGRETRIASSFILDTSTRGADARARARTQITGPWHVSFPPDRGAPESVTLDRLVSWTEHEDFGVRHFSGTAVYETSFALPGDYAKDARRFVLDLGDVQCIAEVAVNRHDAGILWKPPFLTDVTKLLQEGRNTLTVRLTNLWVNRLIGDEYFPEDGAWQARPQSPNMKMITAWPEWLDSDIPRPSPNRVTFTTLRTYTKDSPLMPSGLIGPVMLCGVEGE